MKKWIRNQIKKLIPNSLAKEVILDDHHKYHDSKEKRGTRLWFRDEDMGAARFTGCYMGSCEFAENHFNKSRFAENDFSNTRHIGSDFSSSSFEPVYSKQALFSGATTTVVNGPSKFNGCVFVNANLYKAKFRGCIMTDTHWDNPELGGCKGLLTRELLRAGNFKNRQKEDLAKLSTKENIEKLIAIANITYTKDGSFGSKWLRGFAKNLREAGLQTDNRKSLL